MDTGRLKSYLDARDALPLDKGKALDHLKSALGVDGPTPILDQSLDQVMDPNSLIGDGVLGLVLREATK